MVDISDMLVTGSAMMLCLAATSFGSSLLPLHPDATNARVYYGSSCT